MKKYCLTSCAKKKLTAGKKILIEAISLIAFIMIIGAVFISILFIIGLITQGLWVYFTGSLIGIPLNIIPSGLGMLLIIFTISTILFFVTVILMGIYKSIKSIVTNKMTKTDDWGTTSCKIFEECKE